MMTGSGESDKQKLISASWVVDVKHLLTAVRDEVEVRRVVMRLPPAIVNGNKEAYIPQMVSLGPYHHRTLKDDSVASYHHRLSDISPMEMYKLKSARDAVAVEGRSEIIEGLHKKISEKNMIQKFEKFYDWKVEQDEWAEEGEDESQNFGWMMMVDALFLLQLLKRGFNNRTDRESDHPPAIARIKCDIAKVENQIPLFFLKEVDKALKANKADETKFEDDVQRRISTELCCFEVSGVDIKEAMADEHHLLGCMHQYVSSFLQIQSAEDPVRRTCWKRIATAMDDMVAALFAFVWAHPAKSGNQDFLDKYNATELAKAGIQFKSFSPELGKIRFDKYSDTLFLPRIVISDTYTEVVLRNFLALEFNDGSKQKSVSRYVELMDCLIDAPEDVHLLRNRGIIRRESLMITDDYVAKMWDGMYKSFFTGMLEPPQGLKSQIREVLTKNYYKSKIKTIFTEFYQRHLSKPWLVFALLVGLFVVLLDTTQTYCAFHECQTKSKNSEGNSPEKRFPGFG